MHDSKVTAAGNKTPTGIEVAVIGGADVKSSVDCAPKICHEISSETRGDDVRSSPVNSV